VGFKLNKIGRPPVSPVTFSVMLFGNVFLMEAVVAAWFDKNLGGCCRGFDKKCTYSVVAVGCRLSGYVNHCGPRLVIMLDSLVFFSVCVRCSVRYV